MSAPKLSFKDILMKGVEEEQSKPQPDSSKPRAVVVAKAVEPETIKQEDPAAAKKAEEALKKDLSQIEQETRTVQRGPEDPAIHTLILDAGPLLSQTFSDLQKNAKTFYTTPAVLHTEVRDARARQNIELWQTAGALNVRQPSLHHINAVIDFARKTGDFAVLSTNDIHILALARELDVEVHGKSEAHLRKAPGSVSAKKQDAMKNANFNSPVTYNVKIEKIRPDQEQDESKKQEEEPKKEEEGEAKKDDEDDGWAVVTKKNKKKSFNKNQQKNNTQSEEQQKPALTSTMNDMVVTTSYEEEDDESGWITEENIVETMIKDQYEPDKGSFSSNFNRKPADGDKKEEKKEESAYTTESKKQVEEKFLPVAVSTGDFAMQNVALQMGLNLISPVDGKYVKQVKNHMLRCHACFHLCPIPKSTDVDEIMYRRQKGAPAPITQEDIASQKKKNFKNTSLSASIIGKGLNFCPKCGAANTLKRCTVRVSAKDGHIHVYLKRHMQWSTKGNVVQLPVPQSKNSRRAISTTNGRTRDPNSGSAIIVAEDQVEYERAVVHDWKLRKHNEKVLEEWIGSSDGFDAGLSVSNVSIPFASYNREAARHTGVKIVGGRIGGSGKSRRKK